MFLRIYRVSPHVSRGLDALSGKNKSANPPSLPMDAVVLSLQDLIFYFRPPEEELEHEEKQFKLRSLKNRQNLFQEEVESKIMADWSLMNVLNPVFCLNRE